MMPCISVAMAVYNGAAFLPEQLDSILKQLKDGDEIVVSYDRSTDGTWEILTDYQKRYPQIKLLENQKPGIATNFQNALSACKGDYIFICDQDDRWADTKRDDVVADFQTQKCDVVIHNGVHMDAHGEIISQPFFAMFRIGDGKWKNIAKPRYSGCCTAFTKELAEKILPIPEKIDAYDHWIGTVGEFFGKIYYEDKVLLYHRLHGENATVLSRRSLAVIIKARSKLLFHLVKRSFRRSSY